ncbi:MAG: apolipoprotein N-acyltransferase [Bacteroidia bacterium]
MEIRKRKVPLFFYAMLGGVLFWLAWPSRGFAPLLFIAWIPLLLIEEHFYQNHSGKKAKKIFGLAFLSFSTWNILCTWWVYNSSAFGAGSAIIINSFLMSLVFLLFHFTRCKAGNVFGYVSLPVYWIAFEHLHMYWDLSWPWLTLGNGFASYYKWIQWYEFTGVLGGSLWILVVNILLFHCLPIVTGNRKVKALLALIVVPIVISFMRYYFYEEKISPVNVAVVQPNIDPYNEKFSGMSSQEQLAKLLRLSATVIDSSTNYLIAPETALPSGIWEEDLPIHPDIKLLHSFIKPFPQLTVVIGAATNRQYVEGEPHSETAHRFKKSPGWYDSYNTALQFDNFSDSIQTYHKSKLVPGVEKMPYPTVFGILEKFALDLGGMYGSLGVEDEPKNFIAHDSMRIAPIICYESIYGYYVGEYVRKGARLLCIITNDGWWGETPGHRQHLQYGRLRAIEMRRGIARSANTGISCFINQRGDILQPTKWWTDDAIKATLNANDEMTFYATHGDWLAKIMLVFSAMFLLFSVFRRKRNA